MQSNWLGRTEWTSCRSHHAVSVHTIATDDRQIDSKFAWQNVCKLIKLHHRTMLTVMLLSTCKNPTLTHDLMHTINEQYHLGCQSQCEFLVLIRILSFISNCTYILGGSYRDRSREPTDKIC